jgi:16S rRNA G966 N2-methylase RsmD
MREHIADETIDLVYLDPPFNSARDYNVLFKQAKKDENQAQITAFTDTWQWSKLTYEMFFKEPRNAKLFDLMESLYRGKVVGRTTCRVREDSAICISNIQRRRHCIDTIGT